jgi:hypothetical protein
MRRRLTTPHALLIAVAIAHGVLALCFVVTHHMWWEQDELVYLSQVAAHTPALLFTAPRARGMPALLFPVAHFTTNLDVLRTYLVIIGSFALYFGFRPWLRLVPTHTVPVAAALLASLWTTSFFGAEAQPNYMVAVLGIAAIGYALLSLRHIRRRDPVYCAACVALIGLIRPSDATWLVGGLLLTALGFVAARRKPSRRILWAGGGVIGGLVLGWSEWAIEAQASYGGFFHRLAQANAVNTPGAHFSLATQASAINGPTLCRPCNQAVSVSHVLWWFAIPPLIAVGLYAARRTMRFLPLLTATVAGTALALEYVITVSYAAPRFLLPAYALLSVPVAAGILALIGRARRPRLRLAAISVVVVVALVQLVSQTHFLREQVQASTAARNAYFTQAAVLRGYGVHAPCLIYGPTGPPVAFILGCNDHPIDDTLYPRIFRGTTGVEMSRHRFHLARLPGSTTIQFFKHGQRRSLVGYLIRGG